MDVILRQHWDQIPLIIDSKDVSVKDVSKNVKDVSKSVKDVSLDINNVSGVIKLST